MTYDHWKTTNPADDLDEEPPREKFDLDEEAQRQADWDEALIEFTEREAEDHPTRHIGGYYAGSAGRR